MLVFLFSLAQQIFISSSLKDQQVFLAEWLSWMMPLQAVTQGLKLVHLFSFFFFCGLRIV
jgi:hypothetical protein